MQTENNQSRRVIASKSRATAILERVAQKHDMTVQTLLCARWDRYAIAARAEVATELSHKLKWSQRAIGSFIGCSHPNVRKLFSYHERHVRRAHNLLPETDVVALATVREDMRLQRALEAEERAAFAEAELERVTGVKLAVRLADALGGPVRCAIVLAIVVEAYPRLVLGEEIIEHYDEACARLSYGDQKGASFNLMAKNVAHLRDHFVERGWPVPIPYNDSQMRGARRLTDEAAIWLHERFDAPRASQIEAAREHRSHQVLAVARR